jgi:TonB family protein
MGSSIVIAATLAIFATQAEVPSAPASPILHPTGGWGVQKMARFCSIGRHYTTPGRPLTFGIKPGLFSEYVRLAIIRPATADPISRGIAQIAFDDGRQISAPYFEHVAKKLNALGTVIDLRTADLEPLNSAKVIHIRAGALQVNLAVDTVVEARSAVDSCQRELLVSWGMDPAALSQITNWPRPRSDLFRYSDYPVKSLRKKEQGTTDVRFWVGTDGKTRDCRIVESSGSEILDGQTCAIINRSQFDPARTKDGEPIESISFQRVRWELPR